MCSQSVPAEQIHQIQPAPEPPMVCAAATRERNLNTKFKSRLRDAFSLVDAANVPVLDHYSQEDLSVSHLGV